MTTTNACAICGLPVAPSGRGGHDTTLQEVLTRALTLAKRAPERRQALIYHPAIADRPVATTVIAQEVIDDSTPQSDSPGSEHTAESSDSQASGGHDHGDSQAEHVD